MSTRRLNFTGRQRIERADVTVGLRRDSAGTILFDASLRLDAYGLPTTASVAVEAWRLTTVMRFPFGTIGEIRPPVQEARRLIDFVGEEGIRFRIRVTSTESPAGLLLAEADGLVAGPDEGGREDRVPLLVPMPEDLGEELWRLSFEADGPRLLVNSRVGDWKAVAASAHFRSLVFPAAMREVLWRVQQDGPLDTEDECDWRTRWIAFASAIPGTRSRPPPVDGDREEWRSFIDDAVAGFSRRHRMLASYAAELET